jgi:acyl-CoA thioester hydrolase
MPAIYHYKHVVKKNEIDGQNHVNNLVYLKWMQSAATEHSTAQGWGSDRYKEEGAGWVVKSHFIEYLTSTFENDEIVVKTWISEFKKASSTRKYKMVRLSDNKTLATAETNWAYISLEHRVPRRTPESLREAFVVVTEDQEP